MREIQQANRNCADTGKENTAELCKDWIVHRKIADAEREHYRAIVEMPVVVMIRTGDLVHITIDYAQKVSFPYSSQQVGKMYFKYAYQCHIFGVCNERERRSNIYLYGEDQVADGQGVNSVISMLHHYVMEKYRMRGNVPFKLHIHADNCCGQSKNNYMLAYLTWLMMVGYLTSWEMSFLIAGHTKFYPDQIFGIIKSNYKRSDACDDMEDFADIIKKCTKNVYEV
jgi:hypothetical protein